MIDMDDHHNLRVFCRKVCFDFWGFDFEGSLRLKKETIFEWIILKIDQCLTVI